MGVQDLSSLAFLEMTLCKGLAAFRCEIHHGFPPLGGQVPLLFEKAGHI